MSAKIIPLPGAAAEPVVTPKYNGRRSRVVVSLKNQREVRRAHARFEAEERDRERAERKLQAEEDAKSARFVEEARERIPPERRAEICDLARDLGSLILRLDADDMRTLINQAYYYIGRKAKSPES